MSETTTITVQIGNSDDKLPQWEWSQFVSEVSNEITTPHCNIHFSGGSAGWAAWQNYCWVFVCLNHRIADTKARIIAIRKRYKQDSVAWTEGGTQLL